MEASTELANSTKLPYMKQGTVTITFIENKIVSCQTYLLTVLGLTLRLCSWLEFYVDMSKIDNGTFPYHTDRQYLALQHRPQGMWRTIYYKNTIMSQMT